MPDYLLATDIRSCFGTYLGSLNILWKDNWLPSGARYKRERIYIQDRRQCILWPNLGSDIPIFLPYSTDQYSDQSRYNVKWKHICKAMRWALWPSWKLVTTDIIYTVGRVNYLLSKNILYVQGCLVVLPIPSLCPTTWNEMTNHREMRNSSLTFPKSFHRNSIWNRASLIFKSFLLKRSLSEPIRNAREVNVN